MSTFVPMICGGCHIKYLVLIYAFDVTNIKKFNGMRKKMLFFSLFSYLCAHKMFNITKNDRV